MSLSRTGGMMKRHFTVRYPDDYGEMWFNKDNLMLCINSYCDNKDRSISASDITDGLNELRRRNAELEAEIERLRKAHNAVTDLINSSNGVYGLHLNGEGAPWETLRTGGQFEEWLLDFDEAVLKEVGCGKD